MWRHAITASNDNTEIKVWCCSDWKCLQTVHFRSPQPGAPMQLHAQIDRTSSYLVLSDSRHRGLYVLQVQIDAGGSPPRNHAEAMLTKRLRGSRSSLTGDGAAAAAATASPNSPNTSSGSNSSNGGHGTANTSVAYIKSISEFPMGSSILSYHIVDAAVRRYKCAFNDSYLLEELDDYDEENHSLYCVVLNMYLVQPKSVQECHVLYQPTVDEDADVRSSLEMLNDSSAAAAAAAASASLLSASSSSSSAATAAVTSAAAAAAAEPVPSARRKRSAGSSVSSASDATTTLAAGSEPTGSPAVHSAPADAVVAITTANGSPPAAPAPIVAETHVTATPITLEALMAAVPPSACLPSLEQAKQKVAAVGLPMAAVRSPGTINLMTPDSFQSPRGRESPDGVSSDVRSALQMLASQTGQQQLPPPQQPPPTTASAKSPQSLGRQSSVGAEPLTAAVTATATTTNVLSLAAAGAAVPLLAAAAGVADALKDAGLDEMNGAEEAADAEAIGGRQSVENNQILGECALSSLA